MAHVELRDIYKIFGPKPASVLERVRAGEDKARILEETGHTAALRGVDLSVERSEMFMVMGLSGCGKSTLIRHVNRLVEPTAGQVIIDGDDILTYDEDRLRRLRTHSVAMVFQRFGLLPHKTVVENAAYGLKIRGMDRDERRQKALVWLERVGLKGYAESLPHSLSGGMRQRVGIARALATDPEILLLDEPFSALDPLIRRDMHRVLVELQRELAKTVLFITHDLEEALKLGDRIAMLRDGRVEQVATPRALVERPANDYVAAFVESVDEKISL